MQLMLLKEHDADSKPRLQLAALDDDQEHGGVAAAKGTVECRSAVSNTLQSIRVSWKLAIKGKVLCVLWSWRSDTEGSRLFSKTKIVQREKAIGT